MSEPSLRIASIDEACRRFGGWRSLSPDRERAHLPGELAEGPLGLALADIAAAIVESFPANLFADLDALAASLAGRDPAGLRRATEQVVRLQRLFGQSSPIRFRYAHDFLYGYDWARWVARDPATRAEVGPYDDAFLDYLEGRGEELLALIADDDAKYPTLRARGHRNPFPFSREPAAEAEIHRSLAQRGMIPVEAWSQRARPVWDRPYLTLREDEARRLGHQCSLEKKSPLR